MKRIWGVKCLVCLKRMFSFHVHDYKLCGCKNETMIDGGRAYIRFGHTSEGQMPTSIYWTKKLDGEYPVRKDNSSWPY